MINYKNVEIVSLDQTGPQYFLFICWFITDHDCRRLPYLVHITINPQIFSYIKREKIETIIISLPPV